ncbi:MAG: hypothetical protein AAF403_06195 [Pseudomonadota bacterium]
MHHNHDPKHQTLQQTLHNVLNRPSYHGDCFIEILHEIKKTQQQALALSDYQIGCFYDAKGRLKQALQYYHQATKNDPLNPLYQSALSLKRYEHRNQNLKP